MSKTILEGYIVVPSGDLANVLAELPNHIALTRAEPGCLVFDVQQSLTQLDTFTVYEEFVDKAAFEAHQQRVKASKWGQVAVDVERHYEVRSQD